MKPKNCLIFGASGQIGRNLIRRLTKSNIKVTAVTRNIHQKGYLLKTQANPGYLELVEGNIFDLSLLEKLFKSADFCINLIGILYEKKKGDFKKIHCEFPKMLSSLSSKNNISKFVHLSALGIEDAVDSLYAQSKFEGEKEIISNFKESVILRPSVVYSVDDNFTTNFMSILNLLPFFPLYYKGNTKFRPIHCSELTDFISKIITTNIDEKIIECVGSEEISLKEIIQKLLKSIKKKRILVPMPLFFAKISARVFEIFPKPLLTSDQLRLLKYDNLPSGKYKTNLDFGFQKNLKFDEEIQKYSYMWRDEGEYSKNEKTMDKGIK